MPIILHYFSLVLVKVFQACLQQDHKFNVISIIFFLLVSTCFNVHSDNLIKINKSKVIQISYQAEYQGDWEIMNDSVMGGLSFGQVSVIDNNVTFSGTISTENNGGFTSIFRALSSLSKQVESIRISVIGDGNSYQLRLRSKVQGYTLAYKVNFMTSPNKLETHVFKLTDFKASFRGRNIDDAPLLEAASVQHVGFLFNAKQSQTFLLSIQSIDFFNKAI
jgi:NADH dehydrogenase [ubiquinone] 1 alpha subcomplex assembly factor 1